MMRVRDFTKTGDAAVMPDLAEVQTAAYGDFLQPDRLPEEREEVGLEAILREVFPVESRDGALRIEYLGYRLGAPLREEAACRDLGLTYAAPLYARLRCVGAESIEEDVYLADMPIMMGTGSFIINGSDRVVVAQIQRSPGVDFSESEGKAGRRTQSCRFVPERGTWVELSVSAKDTLQVRLGRSGGMPATWLLRAMLPDAAADAQLLALFYGVEDFNLLGPEGLEPLVGRYLADDILNKETGEVYAPAGSAVSEELALAFYEADMENVAVLKAVDDPLMLRTVQADPCKSHEEALIRIYARFRPGEPASAQRAAAFFAERFGDERNYSLGEVGRFRINRKFNQTVRADRMTLCAEDILNAVRYLVGLRRHEGAPDDIDDLGNRVLRTIDRLLGETMREAMMRWGRMLREQLSAVHENVPSPRSVAATRTIALAVEQFFARGELSQVLDQTNPLAELNHVRRISALGPGGLNRKRAGFEVRDVHPSHYGRICPIETPEGPNIGLIASLGIFAEVDKYGFITTPYRATNGAGGEVRRFRADEEATHLLAPLRPRDGASETMIRRGGEFVLGRMSDVDFVDVSPKQMLGVSASLIPFLEHNDANRALMGSNMQRQAVPLLKTEQPLVATGMEGIVARNSGMVVVARAPGTVTEVDGRHIRVGEETYELRKFRRMNEGTCLNQRPIVREGDKVEAGQVIADGAGTCNGELSLGRNVLVAFMIWDGYDFEDAIIVSEELVEADRYTSVHIEEFTAELRETRMGREEFTRDIPNVPERMLRNLDENGAIRIGTRVQPGDILVGKVAPKSKTDLTPEEKLLREIFGAAGVDVSNESLTLPPGSGGIVVDVRSYRRREKPGGRMPSEERKEAERLRREHTRRLAEAIANMMRDLARLPMLPGEHIRLLGPDAPARDWIQLEQDFRFDLHAFAPEARDQARHHYLMHGSTIEALKVERDRALRKLRSGDELPHGVFEMVKVYVAVKRTLSTGDKMAGRHGNKGVIARVVPKEDMPFLPDGTPVEMILNPLGVPSRMNVGQILETHIGWAGRALGFRAISPVFDGATEEEIRACLREAGLPESGKSVLYDGRTGEPFDQAVTVGQIYMMKLNHLVEEKVHARSTGPYSLITQQPLGGKARMGGQRLGEMEVWALEAYGAAHVLQEMLTVKSDDFEGRGRMYESLVKGQGLLEAGTPQSLQVLIHELRGLGLHLQLGKNSSDGRRGLQAGARRPMKMSAESTAERR